MWQTHRVRWQLTSRVPRVLAVSIVSTALSASSAGASAGTITEYPTPVVTAPYGMTTGPDGKIWFVDGGGHLGGGPYIGRMATSGASSSSDLVQLPSPELGLAAALGPDGNMWVLQDAQVDKVPVGVTNTGQITPYPLENGTGGYGSIVSGPDGRLWFAWDHKVGTITTAGAIEGYETESESSIPDVIVGPGGKLWFGEGTTTGTRIARMDTSGHVGVGDEFTLPSGDGGINAMTLGPDGNVWFTLGNPAAVGRITPTGTITIFPTPTAGSLPFGIAAGPDGRLWFPERNSDKIGAIPTTATSGADITEYPLDHSNAGVLYITAGPDSRMWFSESSGQIGAITTDVTPSGGGTGGGTGGGSEGTTGGGTEGTAGGGTSSGGSLLTSTLPATTMTVGKGPAPVLPPFAHLGSISGATGKLVVKLTCPGGGEACSHLTLKATVAEHLKKGKLVAITAARSEAKVGARVQQVVIAAGVATLTAGSTKTLTLSLNATGGALLKKYGKLSSAVTLTSGGSTQTATAHLKRPVKKKKRRQVAARR
jgi:streptogramin lyase